MANNLTGDYQASLQVSGRLINGLLATLHRNGATDDPPLKLPHLATLRVGDPPKSPALELRADFRQWLRGFQASDRYFEPGRLLASLTLNAPAGAAGKIKDAFAQFGKGKVRKKPPGTVRGRVKLQVSSPTISLTNGSTSEVTLHLDVRAHYYPDAGTSGVVAPEHPVHGEARVVFDIHHQSNKLVIRPSSQDSKIQFIAAQGTHLSQVEVDQIAVVLRAVIREQFTPQPLDLPSGFPFFAFKALGSGSSQTLALPLQLSGDPLSATHLQSVTQSFIGSAGFAFAVSRQFVEQQIQNLSDSIKASVEGFKKIVNRTLDIYYTAKVTSNPSLKWNNGSIDFSIGIKLVGHNSLLGDFDITVKQELKLKLKASTQAVTIKPVGDPEVHGSIIVDLIELLGGGIVKAVKDARDDALDGGGYSINDRVQDTFLGARDKFVQGLRNFDNSASAAFTVVEVTQDGVIVRGEVGSATPQAPVVRIAEIEEGTAFSALQSWIPGGRVDRMIWSWVERSRGKMRIWTDGTRASTEAHRFIFPKPAGLKDLGSVCLRIEGTLTSPDGQVTNVSSATVCNVHDSFGPILEIPSWWEPLTVPLWLPDTKPDTILRDAIAGHLSVQGDMPRKNGPAHNSLVYFADWRADKLLAALARALDLMKRRKVSLVLTVVVPAGGLDCRRSEAEAKLDDVAERLGERLLVTEDSEGAWTRTFATSKLPSAFLINALGELTWKHEGEADPKELAAALDHYLVPAPAPRSRPLRLTNSRCQCHGAPDVVLDDERENPFALHRLRGREVMLNFFHAPSPPCIKELLRLQSLLKNADGRAPFIVGFHDGKERKVIDEIRKQHALTFPIYPDPELRIARKYGVRCWPTTISVDARGRVGHVQFGMAHPQRFL